MEKIKSFLATTAGRWLIKAAIVTFGGLVTQGMIPLEMPIGPFTLGQLLIFAGILTPTGQMNVDPNRLR